jgi:hypothetical protein
LLQGRCDLRRTPGDLVSPGLRSSQFHDRDVMELAGDWGGGRAEKAISRERRRPRNKKAVGIIAGESLIWWWNGIAASLVFVPYALLSFFWHH